MPAPIPRMAPTPRMAPLPWLSPLACLGGSLIGLGAVFAAHPRFGLGIWRDAETVNVVLVCGAGLGLLGAALHAARRRRAGGLAAPVLWALLALSLWSLLSAPFAAYPLTALLGPPQTLYGAVWFAAQAGFVAAALVVAPHAGPFKALALTTAAVSLTMAWFNLRHAPGPLGDLLSAVLPQANLHGFNQYLGYHALALLALAATAWRRGWRRGAVALAGAGFVVLIVSGNRTAWAATAMAVLLVPALWRWRHQPRRSWAWLTGAAVLAVSLILYAVVRLPDAALLPPSLASRQIMIAAIEHSLAQTPSSLLLGYGWGHFPFHLLANLPATGISLTAPNWIDFGRDEFHSHHWLVESLFSAGIPAVVLHGLVPVAVVAGARPALRPIAAARLLARAVVDSLWFMMPENMVPIAIAWAAMSGSMGAPGGGRRRLAPALAAILAAGLMTAGIAMLRDSLAMDGLRHCLRNGQRPCPSAVPTELRQADAALAMLIGETVQEFDRRGWPPRRTERFAGILAEAGQRCGPSCSPALAWALSTAQFHMAYAGKAGAPFSPELWRRAALALAEQAPLRLDGAAAHANWLLLVGKERQAADFLASLPPSSRQTPMALWFSGVLLLGSADGGARERGLTMMRQALDTGAERVVGIDQTIKTALEQGR
mgnify:CR=1 FL=1